MTLETFDIHLGKSSKLFFISARIHETLEMFENFLEETFLLQNSSEKGSEFCAGSRHRNF